jgi:hypothetical protein
MPSIELYYRSYDFNSEAQPVVSLSTRCHIRMGMTMYL